MTAPDMLPCGFIFDSGLPCGAAKDHEVHRGAWNHGDPRREPDHDFQPYDRRSGSDRRRTPSQPDLREALAHPWLIRFVCCGRADGVATRATWEEADALRLAYMDPGNTSHVRSAVIEDALAGRSADEFLTHARSVAWQEAAPRLQGQSLAFQPAPAAVREPEEPARASEPDAP